MPDDRPHVAILGAGPTGLDAALEAARRGWSFRVYEAADRPAGNVRSWGHVRLFSPWSLDASPRMREALADGGAPVPDDETECPTGRELVDTVLDRVAALPEVAPRLALGTAVVAVGREGLLKHEEISSDARRDRPFRLLVRNGSGDSLAERIEHADAVLDCTGALARPNTVGDGGIPALGETGPVAGAIVRRLPDVESERAEWAGKTTLLVGGGHSAWTAARDLARLAASEGGAGTKVVWALRCREVDWRVPDDPLPARDRLAEEAERLAHGEEPAVEPRLGAVVEALAPREGDRVEVTLRPLDGGEPERLTVDRVLALTGAVGDHALYRQLQVHECYASGAPMKLAAALLGAAGDAGDCLAAGGLGAETLLNPEPRFFILGAKSYGRNSAYLMRTGWQQVDDAFELLAGSFG